MSLRSLRHASKPSADVSMKRYNVGIKNFDYDLGNTAMYEANSMDGHNTEMHMILRYHAIYSEPDRTTQSKRKTTESEVPGGDMFRILKAPHRHVNLQHAA